jgi:hypothetical protein
MATLVVKSCRSFVSWEASKVAYLPLSSSLAAVAMEEKGSKQPWIECHFCFALLKLPRTRTPISPTPQSRLGIMRNDRNDACACPFRSSVCSSINDHRWINPWLEETKLVQSESVKTHHGLAGWASTNPPHHTQPKACAFLTAMISPIKHTLIRHYR